MSEFLNFVEKEIAEKKHINYVCMCKYPGTYPFQVNVDLICSFERKEDAQKFCDDQNSIKQNQEFRWLFSCQEVVNLLQDGSK